MKIPGEDGPGVMGVMQFLTRVEDGDTFSGVRRVVVIGGGKTAMDAARTARRMTGTPATVVYRRTREQMPAWPEEIEDCLLEGNMLIELTTPVSIKSRKGKVAALQCLRNTLGEPDAGGRPRPVPVEGSEHDLPADLVIVAIGQDPAYSSDQTRGMILGKNGTIRVNEDTGATDVSCVFSGGDAVQGPSYIIQAVADGRRVADAIARDLGFDLTTRMTGNRNTEPDWATIYHARAHLMKAVPPETLPPEQRSDFDLILKGYSEEQAGNEARRCMQCDRLCDRCVDVCPNRANMPLNIIPRISPIPALRVTETEIRVDGFDLLNIRQERQIIHLDELCNECGNCAVFCTHTGKPYKDKPTFYLDRNHFESSDEDGWYVNEFVMVRRKSGAEINLISGEGDYRVEMDTIRFSITHDFQVSKLIGAGGSEGRISLISVAEMIVLWEAFRLHPVARLH